MALRLPAISGIVPLVLVVLLLTMNAGVLVNGMMSSEEGAPWSGPLMPGKRFLLPDPATAKIIHASGVRQAPSKEEAPQKLQVVEEKREPVAAPPQEIVKSDKYIVQVGEFTSEEGVAPLVARLKSKGHDPKVSIIQKKTQLNNVQAGPFKSLETARESEAKLRASGQDVLMETTEQGYVISLSKSLHLAYAIQDLKRAEAMNISPLRMIKSEATLPVHKVFMGPYNSKAKASEVSERMALIGLAIPKILGWNPVEN